MEFTALESAACGRRNASTTAWPFERMEIAMGFRLSIAVAATLMMGGVGATAAELPSYGVVGFPITPHQFVVLGPANAQELAPAAALIG